MNTDVKKTISRKTNQAALYALLTSEREAQSEFFVAYRKTM